MESTESDYNDLSRDELVDLLVQTKKAQSGSDKTVKKQREQIEELEGKLNTFGQDGTQLQNAAEQIKERERLVQLKEAGISYALEHNIPAQIGAMIAAGAGDVKQTQDGIDTVIEQIDLIAGERTDTEIKDRFGDGHKPKAVDSSPVRYPETYEELLGWDFQNNPVDGATINELVDEATDRGKEKKRLAPRLRRKK